MNDHGEQLMSYKQKNGFGRYWGSKEISIQGISRKIRHTLCKDLMIDIDIKNAHPTLLSWCCHENGIKCRALDDYIHLREDLLADLMKTSDISRDEAKKILLAIINGGMTEIGEDARNVLKFEKEKVVRKIMEQQEKKDVTVAGKKWEEMIADTNINNQYQIGLLNIILN